MYVRRTAHPCKVKMCSPVKNKEHTSQSTVRPSISPVTVGASFQILYSRVRLTITDSDNSKCLQIHIPKNLILPVHLERYGVLLEAVILGVEKFTHWCHEHMQGTEGESFLLWEVVPHRCFIASKCEATKLKM